VADRVEKETNREEQIRIRDQQKRQGSPDTTALAGNLNTI